MKILKLLIYSLIVSSCAHKLDNNKPGELEIKCVPSHCTEIIPHGSIAGPNGGLADGTEFGFHTILSDSLRTVKVRNFPYITFCAIHDLDREKEYTFIVRKRGKDNFEIL